MINKTISIPEEINEKLKGEYNASGLITQLLTEYYKTNVKSISEIEERQREIEEKRKEFIEKYSEDYATLEKRKQIFKKDIATEEERKEIERQKREEKINSIIYYFLDHVGREMSKDELTEYLERLEDEKGFNLFKFVDEVKNKEMGKIPPACLI